MGNINTSCLAGKKCSFCHIFLCYNLIYLFIYLFIHLFYLSFVPLQFATWDLAFHMIPMADLDLEFCQGQLLLLLSDKYMHPNGQVSYHGLVNNSLNTRESESHLKYHLRYHFQIMIDKK